MRRRRPVGLGQQQLVGGGDLLQGLREAGQCRLAGHGIHRGQDRAQREALAQPGVLLQHGGHAERISGAGGLQQHRRKRRQIAAGPGHVEIPQGGAQGALHGTADTAAGQKADRRAHAPGQILVDADLAQLVNHHRQVAALVEPAVKQGGLASAQETGQHHQRNWRRHWLSRIAQGSA